MANTAPEVIEFLEKLDHPLKKEIEQVRALILEVDPNITENIKWNAPSFSYYDEDRITFKLFPHNSVQLIFHRGAKVKDTTNFEYEDTTGLFKWITKDRALVTFQNAEDIDAHKKELAKLVIEWMELTK